MKTSLRSLGLRLGDESGQATVEYAMITWWIIFSVLLVGGTPIVPLLFTALQTYLNTIYYALNSAFF